MSDRVIPNYRIKRILEIDEHMPRMNKKALYTLGKSLKIFLQEYAKDIHKHIVNTGSSYPVKPQHIVNVSFDPRFIKYEFLTHAKQIIETQEHETESINKLMNSEHKHKSGSTSSHLKTEMVDDLSKKVDTNSYISNVECKINNTSGKSSVTNTGLKRNGKSPGKTADKRQKNSILSYFTTK
ncbi:uncharacterized protein TOT_010001262 [Theileria orientalis strain Shintoku]|uniref:Transcription factor CBF/NF-Y/archaeal histone domain-containing protein n=1 Tax=Theileria orientalis strain Shintoku TaxID=869250 RepID=J4C2N1_THEOR|nr:uncharacterized protein TOT_010001262 [Theileria orientalis strain Shintoku]PVC53194.1 hypothetical protein MACL_00000264 [Theileria orientalis]BAM38981.1 uncharacterized protein TOT_010001262 [Theileria orientalis strain Shintoku]|eukprot:XP_009689282.1 uncharacterized protein TOT_010001262 [Theileria orientalis strain Shintoku]